MTRRDIFAAAAHAPWLVYELAELRRGDLGMPYTRYVRLLPSWARKLLLLAIFIIAWDHFINHEN
ncbi:MAG TPA: hypothetical protein VIP28_07285 [Nocardioides sp.]